MPEPLYVPAPLGGTNDRMLAAFADRLRDRVIEGFRLYDVRVRRDFSTGFAPVIRVVVLVDDPPGNGPTWPAERTVALSLAIDRLAWESGIAEPTNVRHINLRSAVEAGFPAETVALARAKAAQAAGSGAAPRP